MTICVSYTNIWCKETFVVFVAPAHVFGWSSLLRSWPAAVIVDLLRWCLNRFHDTTFNENELLLQLRAYFGQVSREAAVGATGAFSSDLITWIGITIWASSEPAFGIVDSEWHDCAQQISEVASVLGRRFAVDDCLPVVHCFWHFVQMCECSTKHNVTMCQCASQIMRRSWVTSSPFEYSSRESHTSAMR